uniref:Rpl16 n=1 Tax=Laurentiella strenua TaxID=114681 RepID=A0A2I4PER2_9SPIT|nr:rpl16 [Laurentiella strenua]
MYKRKQKNRKFYTFKNPAHCENLKYGSAGLRILNVVHLSAKHIFRLKLFLKKASRKSDYTKRFVWFNAFPHLPITKKPTGTRMGKGKGKLDRWYSTVYPGIMLVEFRNLRYGRSLYFFKQLTHKLGVCTKFCCNTAKFLPFPLSLSKRTFFKTRW